MYSRSYEPWKLSAIQLDRGRVDRAVGERHLDAVLLVLVAEVAEAEETHLLRVDALAPRTASSARRVISCEQRVEPRRVLCGQSLVRRVTK